MWIHLRSNIEYLSCSVGNVLLNYRLKTAQSTINPYIARNPINRILLQWQLHEYTPKRNLIINYDISFEGGIRPTGNIRRGKGNETQTVIF